MDIIIYCYLARLGELFLVVYANNQLAKVVFKQAVPNQQSFP